ncbi:MAG: hypothetical protein LBH68_07640 [Bifidobacteriaceae bacterium]|jgi:hypothetical protein|nr:hypothetical protein [Bifidobacteriaceae bacterium]
MQTVAVVVRRIMTGLFALMILPGLVLVGASTSKAEPGCYLQDLVSAGGLLAIPEGCSEDGPVRVSEDAELARGPLTIENGLEVQPGVTLKLSDGFTLTGQIRVKQGARLELSGQGIRVDGTVWTEAGGAAVIKGDLTDGTGVKIGRLANHGVTEVSGLVQIGTPDSPIDVIRVSQFNYLRVSDLAPASKLWFGTPPYAMTVAWVSDQGSQLPATVACAPVTCAASLVSSGGTRWLDLRAAEAGTPPGGSNPPPQSGGDFDLADAIQSAVPGSTITVPDGYVLDEPLTIANSTGGGTHLTLTGGPIRRGHSAGLISVPNGSVLVMRYITVDGSSETLRTEAYAPLVEVQPGGSLTLGDGAILKGNQSFGVVNNGTLSIDGAGAAIEDCTLYAQSLIPPIDPAGGAGVWNRAGGVFWLVSGQIRNNRVAGVEASTSYGGGVLNAGLMRMVGGTIENNTVEGKGGGVAVVREDSASQGGMLDLGSLHSYYPSTPSPSISGNQAIDGGAIAVVDTPEWGGHATALPSVQVPSNAPAVNLARGTLDNNGATSVGGALMASGGTVVVVSGPVEVTDTNEALEPGTSGLAVADSYLQVGGDIQTTEGGGVALLKQGWPLTLTPGFTGSGKLVVERIDSAATWAEPIRLSQQYAPTAAALSSIEVKVPGLDPQVQLVNGKIQVNPALAPDGGGQPTPSTPPPSAQPDPPNQGGTGTPSTPLGPTQQPEPTTPAASGQNNPEPQQGGTQTQGNTGATGAENETGPEPGEEEEVTPPPSASPSASPEPSASAEPDPAPSASAGPDIVTLPDPPTGDSMRVLGFSLMAFGILGLLGLGIFAMRRAGFFAA